MEDIELLALEGDADALEVGRAVMDGWIDERALEALVDEMAGRMDADERGSPRAMC